MSSCSSVRRAARLPRLRADPSGAVLTWSRSSSTSVLLIALTPPLGAYMYRVYTRERTAGIEGRSTASSASTRASSSPGAGTRRRVLWFSLFSMLAPLRRCSASRRRCPSTRRLPAVNKYVSFNTASSFIDEHELAVLRRRDHDELPHPDARPHVPELRLGGGRDGGADRDDPRVHAAKRDELGNFWRDLVRGVVYILLPMAAIVAVILITPGRRPDARRDSRPSRGPRIRAGRSPAARSPARSRSSSSGRTAAGSST